MSLLYASSPPPRTRPCVSATIFKFKQLNIDDKSELEKKLFNVLVIYVFLKTMSTRILIRL